MSTVKKRDTITLGDIYGDILNATRHNLVREGKLGPSKASGAGPGDKELNDKDAASLQDGGPTEEGGFKTPKLDAKRMSKKEKKSNNYDVSKFTCDGSEKNGNTDEDEEENTTISKKIVTESINNFMKKKSVFDKLYESFMDETQNDADDASALGVGDDSEGDFDFGGEGDDLEEGGDEVTVTLPRDVAQQLVDVLQATLGEDVLEDEGGLEGESEGDLEGGELGGEPNFGEEEEESLGTPVTGNVPSALTGKSNKVGGSEVKPAGGKSTYTYMDEVDGDGKVLGHALHGAKQPNMGKNNKVGNLKVGQSAFK
jgi:hypothetical protein